ncbi:unnamed protein product [Amaranthus hypochondriacus]
MFASTSDTSNFVHVFCMRYNSCKFSGIYSYSVHIREDGMDVGTDRPMLTTLKDDGAYLNIIK